MRVHGWAFCRVLWGLVDWFFGVMPLVCDHVWMGWVLSLHYLFYLSVGRIGVMNICKYGSNGCFFPLVSFSAGQYLARSGFPLFSNGRKIGERYSLDELF